MAEMIGGIVIAIIFGLGLFLILRYFWLWYWKIDRIVELLENINNNTTPQSEKKVAKKIVPKDIECIKCQNIYDEAIGLCPKCGKPSPK